jgi:hypothetical protein
MEIISMAVLLRFRGFRVCMHHRGFVAFKTFPWRTMEEEKRRERVEGRADRTDRQKQM